jgi:exonuclease SbcC
MIPVKLTLRNFMPYRDNVPPLDFSGIHTATICGDNGNGKSALIDAMTWALWGEARAKSDDDLIHTGQNEMEVEFDFRVGEQVYRVIRKRAKPKSRRSSGQSLLDFQIAGNGSFSSIAGDSIRQTQQKIIGALHMDYPTFINSALLLQGRADEFTQASPARRKQVLTDILELSQYDTLEERAREMTKQQETDKQQLEHTIQEIDTELLLKPNYEAELEQAQLELSRIEEVMKNRETKLNELRRQRELLQTRQTQLASLEEHISQTNEGLGRWQEQLGQSQQRIEEYQTLIGRRSDIDQGYVQFSETRSLWEQLEAKFRQSVNLERQKSQLENKIKEAGQALLTEHAVIADLQARSEKMPELNRSSQKAQAELNRLLTEEEALNERRKASQELQALVYQLEPSTARLEREIAEIEEKLGLLHTEGEARCPLCETELGTDGLKLIHDKFISEKQQKSDSLKSTRTELASRKEEFDSLQREIAQLDQNLSQEKTSSISTANLVRSQIEQVEQAVKQIEEERDRLAEIEERLARRDFVATEQAVLEQIENELDSLGYDGEQHEETRHRLASLEHYETSRRRLEEAERLVHQEQESSERAKQAIDQLNTSLEADSQRKQELSAGLASLPQLITDLEKAESEFQALGTQQKQAQETVGSVKAKLQRCSELEKRRKDKEKQLGQASKEEQIYRELTEAFGKRGIQALLIERAIPEIEAEANRLLSRMTDNRMHVKMETQRETRSGEIRETLDIKIADELGTRDYEMFSGGEAFRINFSIRIALSKLLARRAGAPLPTLIIDEGFGTQDSTGLEKLKEAIISIQDDFDKIVIITHIEELRDTFPARIDVIKTPEGSTIEVS